jgi:hypothetical protein
LTRRFKKKYAGSRRKYREVHGKVVDFITNSHEDGMSSARNADRHRPESAMLYLSVRFTDKTEVSLRYACDMFVGGADFCDFKTGSFEIIREYIRPIPR